MADKTVHREKVEFKNQVDHAGALNAAAAFTAKSSIGCAPETGFGVYEAAFEIDFQGSSITATDNGLIKTIATLPAACRVIEAYMLTSETFNSADEKGVDLVVASTSPAAADTAMTATATLIAGMELKSGSEGDINSFKSANFSGAGAGDTTVGASGAGTHLCIINTDTSNDAHSITAGKVLVYIKYMGSAAPVSNKSV